MEISLFAWSGSKYLRQPKIPGSSSESGRIDFASETVKFAAAANDDLSQESESREDMQSSPSLQRFNALKNQLLEGRRGGEAQMWIVMLGTATYWWEQRIFASSYIYKATPVSSHLVPGSDVSLNETQSIPGGTLDTSGGGASSSHRHGCQASF